MALRRYPGKKIITELDDEPVRLPITDKQEQDKDSEIYPCADCGCMRSESQGGKIFTVCDECWDKPQEQDKEGTRKDRTEL